MQTRTFKWQYDPGISGFGGKWNITEAPGGVPIEQLVTKSSIDPLTGRRFLDPINGTQVVPSSTPIVLAGRLQPNRRAGVPNVGEVEMTNEQGDTQPVIPRLPLDQWLWQKMMGGKNA